jgi:apolipoprotein N-acyltransferase
LLPLALVPWIAVLYREERPLLALAGGFVLGLVFWCVSIPWISFVVTHFGGQPGWMGPVCVFVLAAILSEWPALVGWACAAAFPPSSKWRLAAFPILWMASEHARSVVYKGFPWNLTANALFRHPALLRSASIWGAFGVGGLIAACSAGIAGLILLRSRGERLGAAATLFTVAALLVLPSGRGELHEDRGSVQVVCLQPNIAQVERLDWLRAAENYRSVMEQVEEAARRRPDLILIPESALPAGWQESAVVRTDLLAAAKICGCAILFNDIDEESESVYYNAARLLTPSGSLLTYRKVHLVPFGEYVPLPKLFFFMRSVTRAVGAFAPAAEPVVLTSGPLRIGPAVCYEMTYPDLVRREVRLGANLLATLSNDAWYGKAGAQEQHFAAMVLRAVENGRPFARSAITGISGVVDSHGRVLAELGADRRGLAAAAVTPGPGFTVWTRWGAAFLLAADLFALAVLMLGLLHRGKRT